MPNDASEARVKNKKRSRSKKTTEASRTNVRRERTAKGQPWTFPKNTLEAAIKIAKAIEEKNAGNPMPAKDLATAVGFRRAQDWRFQDLLRSANLYGLVSGTGASASVQLTKLGQDVVAPSSPTQRSEALLSAFESVSEFDAVDKFYGGKRIPEDEFFLNTLTREINIPRDRVETFAKIFLENLKFLRAFRPPSIDTDRIPSADIATGLETPSDKTSTIAMTKGPRVREFLDTCFVMMPFGSWFNQYYQEIYAPAIKDAGFEPVRADELFSTGSVVEQIWEQIEKAQLLLADLSGKNPNVFYELGLAHAAKKPVVFTSSTIEDVPFDLRHLRVITYDVREPEWASALRKSVTDYLRNAIKEPGKSIPHPFRVMRDESEIEEGSSRK